MNSVKFPLYLLVHVHLLWMEEGEYFSDGICLVEILEENGKPRILCLLYSRMFAGKIFKQGCHMFVLVLMIIYV